MVQLIKREIFDELSAHVLKKEVTVITGPRQTGKTTLIYQLKDWLIEKKKIPPSQIKFFNLDLITDLEGLDGQEEFIKFIKEELRRGKFLYIFIDEIQRLENPGKFLKGIYDLNLPVKLIVTGSSSLEIKSRIFESLAGRKRVFNIWPFSFKEYLRVCAPELLDLIDERNISHINKKKILEHLYDFTIFGGYPRVAFAQNKDEKIKIISEIYSSYVEKDIVGFMNIKHPLTFTKLLAILGAQTGGLLNFQEICNTLRINFRTVENYISALESTFVIKPVRPYFTNIRKELTKMPKIYFTDNGLRNFSLRYFANFTENRDKGPLLENFVFSSLIKCWDGGINYWRTKDKNEVDFILSDYYGNAIPVEVKATELRKIEIGSGIRSFIDRYSPKNAFIINLSLEEKVKHNRTHIHFLLPYSIKNLIKEIG